MTDLSLTARREALHRDAPEAVAPINLAALLRRIPIGVYSSIGLIAGWAVVSEMHLVPALFLPSPITVLQQFIVVATDGFSNATLAQHAGTSLFRVLFAFAIAASVGIPLGLAMGVNRWVRGVFDPPISFYWPIPPLAYLPLIIIWLGIGEAAKIALITLAMLAPIVVNAQAGVRSVLEGRIQAALSLGASRRQVFFHVIARGALPEILTGLRIAVGFGWGTLVAAELVAATRGLGFMTLSAAQFLVTEVVFVGIFSIAALAMLCLAAIRLLERLLTPWKGKD
ncbi:MAG TPA: ABC transporter permease subunit [Dongiaceae bacterium]|jgi:taurine transport system permease protein|nr:ABC transporter permease subunit [Dongiaceae bacterium]